MLRYAGVFFAIAVAAAFAGGSAGDTGELARILCYVFVLVAVVTFILGLLKQ